MNDHVAEPFRSLVNSVLNLRQNVIISPPCNCTACESRIKKAIELAERIDRENREFHEAVERAKTIGTLG